MHGPITCSRIAVVAKRRSGELKVRLVHELRRSGVNVKEKTHERVVLPRATDVVSDALDQKEEAKSKEVVFRASTTKTLSSSSWWTPRERRHLGGSARAGDFVYRVLLFGGKSGPSGGGPPHSSCASQRQ